MPTPSEEVEHQVLDLRCPQWRGRAWLRFEPGLATRTMIWILPRQHVLHLWELDRLTREVIRALTTIDTRYERDPR